MGCGITTVKVLLFIFNVFFSIIALAILALGVIALSEGKEDAQIHAISLIVVGAIGFIIAFYGCCGAVRESHCMMITFAVFLLLVLILEVVVGVFLFLGREEIVTSVKEPLAYFADYHTGNTTIDKEVDETQKTFSCCGLDGPSYWTRQGFNVPESCCEEMKLGCSTYFLPGCEDQINAIIYIFEILFWLVFGIVILVEVIGIGFACCLANSIKNKIRRGRI